MHDAKAVAAALESKGVQVFAIYDCNITELKAIVQEFVNALQKGDTAIVFFAGHGVEYNNANRLVAIPQSGEPDLIKEALNLLALLDRLATSCCRCNRSKTPPYSQQNFSERDQPEHFHSRLLSRISLYLV